MLDQIYYDKADEIIELHGANQASLISIIQDIQSEYRYLPPELLSYVAKKIGITEAKAYSVATFYENFSFEPKGKYVIKVCDGTACHVRKSTAILDALRKELNLTADKVTTDDYFLLHVLDETLTYQVDQIHIVLPNEMDDLAITEGEDHCTLVTCTPYGINTHRMLVRGTRVENSVADTVAARVTADAIQVDTLIVTPIVAAPMLLLFITAVVLQGKKKRK